MAVSSSPSPNPKKARKQSEGGGDLPPPAKRRKNPEVRVVGGRIYDSQNGKTCHQCRQKTMDFVAACKNQKDKPCTIMFCHKCLFNRYGEKAEEMAAAENWKCPKCRGICNCSFCMKKRGHQPTGILVHTARATGYSSVSDLLHVKGPENVGAGKVMGLKKHVASESDRVALLPIKQDENTFCDDQKKAKDGITKENQVNKSTKLGKSKGMKKANARTTCSSNGKLKEIPQEFEEKGVVSVKEATPKKPQVEKTSLKDAPNDQQKHEVSKKEVKCNKTVGALEQEKKPQTSVSLGLPSKRIEFECETQNSVASIEVIDTLETKELDKVRAHQGIVVDSHKQETNQVEIPNKDTNIEITLPKGSEMTTVASIGLQPVDVGHALQFLEFCAAFGKVLNLKKGEPEYVLRELITGGRARRGKVSAASQFHVQLVSLLLEELGESSEVSANGKTSWLHVLKDCASISQCVLEKLKLKQQGREYDSYDSLNSSQKLTLLNFICDELLCTEKLRTWINDQDSKYKEEVKEAKDKVLAAKQKEKELKQKMQDELAKAIISKNGAPLSISEHDAIVSRIKTKSALAHAEMLEAKGVVPNEKQKVDAVRTQPLMLDADGRIFWKLKGHSNEPNIFLQDLGTWDAVRSGEKWFTYGTEQEKEINEYICYLRKRKVRPQVTRKLSSRTETADGIE